MTVRTYRTVPGVVFPWESQRDQYDRRNGPGIVHETHFIERADPWHRYPIECLLWYGDDRRLHGILNTYPAGSPGFEEPGAINLWVDPLRQRRGIASALMDEYRRLWGEPDWAAQRVSPSGRRFLDAYRDRLEASGH